MRIERAKYPMCMIEDCNRFAEYEFTDVVKVDPKSFPTKRITIGYSCDEHFENVKKIQSKGDKK